MPRCQCLVSWAGEEAETDCDPPACNLMPSHLLPEPTSPQCQQRDSSSSSSSHRGTGWQNRSGTSLQLVWVNPAVKGKSKERGRNTKSYTSTYLSFLFGAWEQIKTETYKSFKKKKPHLQCLFSLFVPFFLIVCLFLWAMTADHFVSYTGHSSGSKCKLPEDPLSLKKQTKHK